MSDQGEERIDWYDQALYYDIIFDVDSDREADFLEGVSRRYGRGAPGRALEPACGTGRLLVEMGARRWRMTGLDLSAGALAFARGKLRAAGLSARLLHTPMQSFALAPTFDLAFCLVNTFRYLLSEDDSRRHLQCVAAALRPGGIYVLGLHLTDYHDRSSGEERWRGEREGVKVFCAIGGEAPNRAARRERVEARLTVHQAGRRRRFRSDWTFRTYGPRQLRSLLASVPALEHVATHDFDLDASRPTEFGGDQLDQMLILRKR
jgi:SAM-dependent methyltransferase